jgi:hypothetical protein
MSKTFDGTSNVIEFRGKPLPKGCASSEWFQMPHLDEPDNAIYAFDMATRKWNPLPER